MNSDNVTALYDVTTLAEDDSLKIIRTTVLLLFLLLSLLGNSLILFAICVSSKRSCRPFNAYHLSMAAFGLLECSLSMPFATGFSLEGNWIFGEFLKGFNACFVQLQNIGVLLTLAAMAADRYLAVKDQLVYRQNSNIHHANYIVLYTWIHAFIISLPLLFHNESLGLEVRGYLERCLCGLSADTTIIYTIFLTVSSYGLPFLLIIGVFIKIFVTFAKERKAVRRSTTANYANYCLQESQLLMEMKYARYVLLLFCLYLLLKAPYVFVDVLTQFGVEGAYVPTITNTTDNITIVVEQASEDKFYYQTAITWATFCFCAMYPMVTFALFAEHKRRVRIHLCCGANQIPSRERNGRNEKRRRLRDNYSNNRTNNNNGRIENDTDKYGKRRLNNADTRKTKSKLAVFGISRLGGGKTVAKQEKPKGFHVPVLYAAADGLHLASTKLPMRSSGLERNGQAPSATTFEEAIETSREKNSGAGSVADSSSGAAGKAVGEQVQIGQKSTKALLTLNAAELVKCLKKVGMNGATGNVGIKSSEMDPNEATFENRSIVDQRVDVLGSTDGLQSEEENYLHCAASDFEDETDSELNESANSRTLILPHRGPGTTKKSNWVRNSSISPLPLQKVAEKHLGRPLQSPENWSCMPSDSSASLPDLFRRTEVSLSLQSVGGMVQDASLFSSNSRLQEIIEYDVVDSVGSPDFNHDADMAFAKVNEIISIPGNSIVDLRKAVDRVGVRWAPALLRRGVDSELEVESSGGPSRLTLSRGSLHGFMPHQLRNPRLFESDRNCRIHSQR